LTPPEAADIQSLGNVRVANTVPESAVAHVAGWAPVRILKMGEVPMVVSRTSRVEFRTVMDSWIAIKTS